MSVPEPNWELIAESLPQIVWIGAPDGSTEYFNRLGVEYTGVANPRYEDWLTIVHPDDVERLSRGWEGAVRGVVSAPEYRLRRLDGEFRWHALRSRPVVGDDGAVQAWIVVATDIEAQRVASHGEGIRGVSALRVLVVEDEAPTRALLVAILENDGYTVCAVAGGTEALAAAVEFRPDIALVDGGAPAGDGVDVARRLRQGSELPIIFVTGADAAEDVHAGFRAGADDYILKPFDPEELSWRVRAVLNRAGHAVTQVWEVGDLVVDERTSLVTRAGAPVQLTVMEFKLLSTLVRNGSRVVPKGQLVGQIWGYDADDHLLEVHMSALRRKLEQHGPRIIQTIRGIGYVLRR